MNLDKFLSAYITCALWSSTGDNEEPLDRNYDADDLHPDTLKKMREDCEAFIEANATLLESIERRGRGDWTPDEQAGHDFWLTRNRHGVGFWDRGLGAVGDKLTEAAHTFGECDLYVGDDGKLYVS